MEYEIKVLLNDKGAPNPTPPESPDVIFTGIGFLDHMIDQIRSHGQLSITCVVAVKSKSGGKGNESEKMNMSETLEFISSMKHDEGEVMKKVEFVNRFADHDQDNLLSQIGSSLGLHLTKIFPTLPQSTSTSSPTSFSCPLDESLTTCTLTPVVTTEDNKGNKLSYNLEPYANRSHLGSLLLSSVKSLFTSISQAFLNNLKLHVRLYNHTGNNAHHIVECSFKAFSRCIRKVVDGLYDGGGKGVKRKMVVEGERSAIRTRVTKETSITCSLTLPTHPSRPQLLSITTPIPILTTLLENFASSFKLNKLGLEVVGDVWIDDHHTAEDVSIAVGQCIDSALVEKGGITRMASCYVDVGGDDGGGDGEGGKVLVVVDVSNRPYFGCDVDFESAGEEYVIPSASSVEDSDSNSKNNGMKLSTEMIHHILDSIITNSKLTVHMRYIPSSSAASATATVAGGKEKQRVGEAYNKAVACIKGLGECLRDCVEVDWRRGGVTASSKGTLSV